MPARPAARLALAASRLFLVASLLGAALSAPPPVTVQAAGGFALATGLALAPVEEICAAWGDYDNDGRLDLLVAGKANDGTGATTLYHQKADGIFEDSGIAFAGVSWPAVAWGDYDRDGYLDILLAGATGSATCATKLYHNDGSGGFVEVVGAGLPGLCWPALAWGDYDNDGDLDILASGDPDGNPATAGITRIYRNDGGTFTDIGATLAGVIDGSVAWGDYNGDNRLDIVLTGTSGGTGVAKVYRNNGDGSFTDIEASLTAVQQGDAAWGDYDADGDLDILLAGLNGDGNDVAMVYNQVATGNFQLRCNLVGTHLGSAAWGDYDSDGDLDILLAGLSGSTYMTTICHNAGSDTFSPVDMGLPGVAYGCAAWGDYDNDRDLDIALVGKAGSGSLAAIYRNDSTTTNNPPAAPYALNSTVSGRSVTLDWKLRSPADDHDSAGKGLSFNLRVGTAAGGWDVVSPMADTSTGWRRLPALGNAQQGLTARLDNLPPGVYDWSVQAIDTAFLGGAWANAGSFSICQPPDGVALDGPAEGAAGRQCVFTATVSPLTATTPITYVWQAEGQAPITITAGISASTAAGWSQPGVHAITVTVRNGCGAVTATRAITLCQPPMAGFMADPTSGPAPLAVTFTGQPGGEIDYWEWDLGDGTTSYGQGPLQHTYARPGCYTVTLLVSNTCSEAREVKESYISAWLQVAETIAIEGPAMAPVGGTAAFTATVTPLTATIPITYTWEAEGQPPVAHGGRYARSDVAAFTWEAPGPHVITVTADNGGPIASATHTVTVCEALEAAFDTEPNPAVGPVPLVVTFTSRSIGGWTDVLWDFGDGVTSTAAGPVHTYESPGVYSVTLAAVGWCTTAVRIVPECIAALGAPPQGLAIEGPTQGRAGETYAFTATVSPASTTLPLTYTWTVDGHAPVLDPGKGLSDVAGFSWGSPGPHAVTVTATNGWGQVAATHLITLCQPPVADLAAEPTSGPAPLLVRFSNATTGEYTSTLWTFGDGTTSTGAEPSNIYLHPGVYTVTLQVSGPCGTDTKVKAAYITAWLQPPAGVTVDGPEAGSMGAPQTFTATVSPLTATVPITFTWNRDGGPQEVHAEVWATADSISYTWDSPGPRTITVTADNGTLVTGTHLIDVTCPPPTAAFSAAPASGAAPLVVTFANEATGSYADVLWEFGDGLTSTADSPVHTYSSPGAYTVTLTVAGPCGSDTLTQTTYIAACQPPVAGFGATPTSGYAPLVVSFTNQSSGGYTGTLWEFGDGVTSTLLSPLHTYASPGVYTVTLAVANDCDKGVKAVPGYITVLCAPPEGVEIAGPLTGAIDTEYTFTATVTPVMATLPVAYRWEADGLAPVEHESGGLTDSATFSWAGGGSRAITVTAGNCAGTVTGTYAITLCAPPVASFTATARTGVVSLTVTFTNTSTGVYTACLWTFGDGASSAEVNPTHTYAAPGYYDVSLAVGGDCGSSSIAETRFIAVLRRTYRRHLPLLIRSAGKQPAGLATMTTVVTSTCSWPRGPTAAAPHSTTTTASPRSWARACLDSSGRRWPGSTMTGTWAHYSRAPRSPGHVRSCGLAAASHSPGQAGSPAGA